MNKICNTCKKEKDIEEFAWRNKSKNIRSSECKVCHKQFRKDHYETNKVSEKKRIYDRRRELAMWFNEYKKTLKCECCQENHPSCIEFHHTNPKEKEINVSECTSDGWSKERIMKEVAKCRVLCANCHRKIHAGLVSSGSTAVFQTDGVGSIPTTRTIM